MAFAPYWLMPTPCPKPVTVKRKLLPEWAENIGIVTNDFHIFRALATARHVSALSFSGIPASSTGYGFTHYALREFFAVGAGLIKGELSF